MCVCFQTGEITACFHTDGNNPGETAMLVGAGSRGELVEGGLLERTPQLLPDSELIGVVVFEGDTGVLEMTPGWAQDPWVLT